MNAIEAIRAQQAQEAALAATAAANKPVEATSSLLNENVGICPKCLAPMGRGKIASGKEVFYCKPDRVSLPLPNAA